MPPAAKKARTEPAAAAAKHTGQEIRRKLHDGERVYGTCCLSTQPKWPAALAACGIDVIFIDTEHVPIPIDTLAWMCNSFSGLGVVPICRVPEPEPYKVCEYLDAGANGIVAPYLETVEQVKMLVGCTKLRPIKGEKLKKILDGLTPLTPEQAKRGTEALYQQVDAILGETNTSAFMRKKNKNNILLLNIESVAAVNRLEELVSIPGVDGCLVGPHDLSCNYGVPEQWTSRTFLDPIDRIIDVSARYNMGSGIHYSFTNQLELQVEWSKRGANLVMHSADVKLVARQLTADLAAIRAGNGDAAVESGEVEGV